MKLVIVESPAKGRTIEKYLGSDYKVLASFGHVRDLPEGKIGVDTAHNFEPEYRILPKAEKTIAALQDVLKKADTVYLATDYDREGEAIAWHLTEALGLGKREARSEKRIEKNGLSKNLSPIASRQSPALEVHRITFHEITKDAIRDAVAHPRAIDTHLVDAQQARRILDRLVGYKLSPFLWKKLFKGLSAGRVQSVAVRIIVDREREILAFVPVEYWSIEADLTKRMANGEQRIEDAFTAQLVGHNGQKVEKLTIKTAAEAEKIDQQLQQAAYSVRSLETTDQQKYPSAPFTTSTLQQEASRKLGFSAKKTMKVAQDLYEDGKITYMRTDSMNLASEAIAAVRTLIQNKFGPSYLPSGPRLYKTKAKGAQEAHEAIRPTDVSLTAEALGAGDYDHQRLYELIWQRTIACQMQPAIMAVSKIIVDALNAGDKFELSATGSMVKFDGFMRVWPVKLEERSLPTLGKGDSLDLVELHKDQHFTEPPARYNEASLIKALEEHGIGRPSTYAPTMATIVDRGYVQLEKRVFFPQEIGMIVTDLLKEHFPDIVDIGFTAAIEENLDKIAEGEANWVKVLHDFYDPFEKLLETKIETVSKQQLITETTDEICDKCAKPMQVKMGRFGKFLACIGFPDCRNAKPIVVSTGLKCPICAEGELVERKTRRGKTFWSCNRYPDCKAATWDLAKPATLPDPNKVAQWKTRKTSKSTKSPKKTAKSKK